MVGENGIDARSAALLTPTLNRVARYRSKLSHAEKDALILTLMVRLDEAHKLIAELRAD